MPERPSLLEASDLYEVFGRAQGLAPGTIRNRTQAVRTIARVVGDLQVESITSQHMERVFLSSSWGPTTRNVRIGIYRYFFSWCRSRRYVSRDHDPMFGWRGTKVPEVERSRYPVGVWPKLFAAATEPNERIVFALGLYLFLRSSEITGIRVRDVDLGSGLVEIYRPKTKQRDLMPISTELDRILREHLTWMSERGFADPESFIVPGYSKTYERDERNRWIAGTTGYDPSRSATQLHRIIQRVFARADLPLRSGEGAHVLRRSGARAYFDYLREEGYDGALRRVQSMLGHRSALMTEVYLGLDLDRAMRNSDLAGKPMFPELGSNLISLQEVGS